MKQDIYSKAIQLALRVGRKDNEVPHKIVDLNQFTGEKELTFSKKSTTKTHSFFMLDVTLCEDEKWRLIEANGSNAALSSTAQLGDEKRAKHLVEVFEKNDSMGKCVVLFVHQFRFIHLGEFFCRAAKFTEYLSKDYSVRLRSSDEGLGSERVTVVAGEIKEVADHISFEGKHLHYKGVPVLLVSNPNLLPQLERKGLDVSQIGKKIVHEQECCSLIHDKSLQQTMCLNSGLEALHFEEALNKEQCFNILAKAKSRKMILVAKMNAGSGGTGIEFFTPDMNMMSITEKLNNLEKSVISKYGLEAIKTMYPIRFFEFAKAKGLIIEGNEHLWDLRMMVLVRPGEVQISPCVVRACPSPFDGSFSKESVINNLSGRVDPDSLKKYILPNPFIKNGEFQNGLAIPESKLDELVDGIVKWTENATEYYT